MKTKYLQLIFMLVTWTLALSAQISDPEWNKQSGVSGCDFFTDVIEDANKGFTVIGARNVKNNSFDFWVIRYSPSGDTIWAKTIGTKYTEIPKRITQLNDKTYILLGTSQKEEKPEIFLVRIDENGKELWKKTLNNKYLAAEDIVSVDDNKFVVVGAKGIQGENPKLWMAEFDCNAEVIWEKTYNEHMNGCARAIKKLPAGGFVIASQISEAGKKDCDIIVFRTDPKGKAKWYSWIKTPGQKVWPECICCSPDSCFVVVGWKGKCIGDLNASDPVFDFDLVINKISCHGEIEWTKSIDREGSEGGNALTIRPDGTFIVAGIKMTSFLGKIGPWLLNIDPEGNELNEKLLKFQFNNDHASRIINCSDGGFILIGPGVQEASNTRSDGWIIKFAN